MRVCIQYVFAKVVFKKKSCGKSFKNAAIKMRYPPPTPQANPLIQMLHCAAKLSHFHVTVVYQYMMQHFPSPSMPKCFLFNPKTTKKRKCILFLTTQHAHESSHLPPKQHEIFLLQNATIQTLFSSFFGWEKTKKKKLWGQQLLWLQHAALIKDDECLFNHWN